MDKGLYNACWLFFVTTLLYFNKYERTKDNLALYATIEKRPTYCY